MNKNTTTDSSYTDVAGSLTTTDSTSDLITLTDADIGNLTWTATPNYSHYTWNDTTLEDLESKSEDLDELIEFIDSLPDNWKLIFLLDERIGSLIKKHKK